MYAAVCVKKDKFSGGKRLKLDAIKDGKIRTVVELEVSEPQVNYGTALAHCDYVHHSVIRSHCIYYADIMSKHSFLLFSSQQVASQMNFRNPTDVYRLARGKPNTYMQYFHRLHPDLLQLTQWTQHTSGKEEPTVASGNIRFNCWFQPGQTFYHFGWTVDTCGITKLPTEDTIHCWL